MINGEKYVNGSWVISEIPTRKLHNKTDIITSLPVDIYTDGQTASADIKGNMVQSGTPTPTTPITPSECGDLSENLYNASSPNIFRGYYNSTTNTLLTTENNAFIYVPLVQGKKYYVYGCKRYNTSVTIRWVTISSTPFYNIPCIRTGVFEQSDIFTITAETNENYLALFLCGDSDYTGYGSVEAAITANCDDLVIDNGYKLDIKSGSTTTPVYLGQVQSTRKIKKLVLTGQESSWTYEDTYERFGISVSDMYVYDTRLATIVCTHYPCIDDGRPIGEVPNNTIYAGKSIPPKLFIKTDSYTTINDFKTYLQQQYAAGTPVCVWYVLETETTGIVNEPLRKMSSYADSVSVTGIPTTASGIEFDVDTSLKPSEVDLTYHGWHDISPLQRVNGQWV